MTLYHVSISSKPTASQPSETITVRYEAPNYNDAWVGSRTVCRIGTMFKDDPKCKNPASAREFFLDDGSKFEVGPAQWTVRAIFVENTRKTGKQRMTNLSQDDVLGVLEKKGVKVSAKLRGVLDELLGTAEGGGLRVTVATARRLGIEGDEAGANEE